MTLILVYIAVVLGGAIADYFVSLLVEYEWGPHVSLIVFPGPLFFLSLALLGASGLGNDTESFRTNRKMKAPYRCRRMSGS
jgi:hypothetical protein